MEELTNKAIITVTFYKGAGDTSLDWLSRKYVVKNWRDENHLRQLLDDIAREMNHISGYGILAIQVDSEHMNFTVDYKSRYKPYKLETAHYSFDEFRDILRFNVGYFAGMR